MGGGEYASVKLHEQKELTTQCAEVLNEEWPRSLTARCLMLEKSNDNFPYCIVLLDKSQNESIGKVVGHSRLCKVFGMENACFVESVVIAKDRRGQGLGRILMEESEIHAKRLGCTTLYLTTHDKQDFYGHMKYVFCDPIISFGSASNLISDKLAEALMGSASVSQLQPKEKKNSNSTQREQTDDIQDTSDFGTSSGATVPNLPSVPSVPPPPPPPPPQNSIPPPPPPPTTNSAILRMDPTAVHWMKKVLVD